MTIQLFMQIKAKVIFAEFKFAARAYVELDISNILYIFNIYGW